MVLEDIRDNSSSNIPLPSNNNTIRMSSVQLSPRHADESAVRRTTTGLLPARDIMEDITNRHHLRIHTNTRMYVRHEVDNAAQSLTKNSLLHSNTAGMAAYLPINHNMADQVRDEMPFKSPRLG